MNSGIIGTIVYAYKHKDYGDVFLILKDTSKYTFFNTTDKAFEAIYNYHENHDKFEKMFGDDYDKEFTDMTEKDFIDNMVFEVFPKGRNRMDFKDFLGELFKALPSDKTTWRNN